MREVQGVEDQVERARGAKMKASREGKETRQVKLG